VVRRAPAVAVRRRLRDAVGRRQVVGEEVWHSPEATTIKERPGEVDAVERKRRSSAA